ncbi:MAG: DUF4194 domain-containing protein [Candidatus Rifleibacteriota bacterium]
MNENSTADRKNSNLSKLLITLLKGIIYRDDDPEQWQQLLDLENQVRDYFSVIGIELMFDESEGYAWLRNLEAESEQENLPRLVVRRQLSYPVSLLIALLRKKLAEADAGSGETRLILLVEEIVEMSKVFLCTGNNEARFHDQVKTWLKKIAELGFIRKLKNDNSRIEVCRIIKAYVDAQWLNEFDERLQEYIEFSEQKQ